MAIDFSLTKRQHELREAVHGFAKSVVRPQSLEWDREHRVPEDFLRNVVAMASAMGANVALGPAAASDEGPKKKRAQENVSAVVLAEEMAWGDGALLLSMPGPGLGGPPVRASGTPEQRERFFGIFRDMSSELRWGAYALTEPGAGSDVAGIRTSCRKDGGHWILNGRKCFITNGARASWNVVFATLDPAMGRAGHRAFVVERGTPGFSVGKIEDKMGLRASETAELVFDDCLVPAENLLGGDESYVSKEGFMTAMKTFDNTRPLVAAMACGIGRAAYELARDVVKRDARMGPRYAAVAERLARVGQRLEAARVVTYRAAWLGDMEQPNAKEASMSKALAGQAAINACIEAIDLCGASGAIAGGERGFLAKWFRDIKVYDIFEGTGQIQRIVISKRLFPDLRAF